MLSHPGPGPLHWPAPFLSSTTANLSRVLLVQNTCQVTGSQSGKVIHSKVLIHRFIKHLLSTPAPVLGVNVWPGPLGCVINVQCGNFGLGGQMVPVLNLTLSLARYYPGKIYVALLVSSSVNGGNNNSLQFLDFKDNSIQWLGHSGC